MLTQPGNSSSAEAAATTSPRGWAALLLNRLHYSSVVLSSFAFGLFLPFVREDLHLSYLQIGLLQGVWWITTAVALVPLSVVFSRMDPNRRVMGVLAVITPMVFCQGLAVGFWTLLAARFFTVLTYAALAPVRPLLLRRWAAPKDYSIVTAVGLSVHSTLMAGVLTFSPLIIVALGSWRLAYFIQGGMMAAHFLIWTTLTSTAKAGPSVRSANDRTEQSNDGARAKDAATALMQDGGVSPIGALRRYPHAWLLGTVMLCLAASWTTVLTFLPVILETERNIAITSGSILFGFLYYALIPGAPLGGQIFKRITDRRLMILIPAVFNTGFTFAALLAGNQALVAIGLTGLGLVWVFVPAMEVLPFDFKDIHEREVSVITALVLTFSAVGFAAGPLAAGIIAELSGSLMTGVLSVAAGTSVAVIAALLFPRDPAAVTLRHRPAAVANT